MAKKRKKIWVYSPAKLPKPKVPEAEKKLILEKCSQFIESELKPKCITSESNNPFFRLVDIFGKWYRNFFHFYAVYDSLDPDSPKPSFKKRFTRLEYVAPDRFNIAYMRHTGNWWETHSNLTLEECFDRIRTTEILQPY
ncbi:MAG: hypothetical protein J7545_13190 [Roseofilum sp. SBFL]|uniref:DUF3024 domain-containing protein n=1 Tax=unclassified Roseofilum TaxID=2620099 RepID=UPI001B2CBD36|nr:MULTISPECIES: hypothetical protein [unclassified Roseofilum]MBP0013200.1 hypothetical protein [Roseofilum sp. SID3]MBP0022926.1 hypothetical protein [Roseofilum sp. SID2]MBP0036195.1 hypothetical protein [Roseofilum sp. SID1]MBP0042908.1 hypothetical protein [Roseofilum sp. SBFL]